jgi:murein DD-endopeptidase MepM/ murein hydrolase activator NlpD
MSGDRGASEGGDVVTLIYVPGQSGAIQRFNVPRKWIRRATAGAVAFAVALLALSVDYVRARRQLTELDYLRTETSEQREQLVAYSGQVEKISEHLARISQFDRKLRVITNLDPADPLPLPGIGGIDEDLLSADGLTREGRHRRMTQSFARLDEAASTEAQSLQNLIQHLENQQARLAATPSIVPTRGWVTSSYGYRASPFTGNREFHHGIDIAGRMGTPILAPADGVVRFAGKRRGLGKTLKITHGYGMETIYGHLAEIDVKAGEKVRRGQVIAKMGNTGRSTGPHLHYQVEVSGKPVNPSNYMLD